MALREKVRRHGVILGAPLDNPARCRECGGACCSAFTSVELTWDEYLRLKSLGGTRLELSMTGRCFLLIENGCEFLAGGRCAVYDNRPEICRRFYCEEKR